MYAHPINGPSMRILFVASEGLPFSKTGGLADVVEALPKALVAQGHEVAAVLPRYRGTKATAVGRSEEHTSELQSQSNIVCRLLPEKKREQLQAELVIA